MSYGVWRKRGQGWSMIEIDSPGNDARYQWRDVIQSLGEKAAEAKKRQFYNQGLGCSTDIFSDYAEDDLNFLTWASNQKRKKGWKIYEIQEGDHCIWISVAPTTDLKAVLTHLDRADADTTEVCARKPERHSYDW